MMQKIVVGIAIVWVIAVAFVFILPVVTSTNSYGNRDLTNPLINTTPTSQWYNPTYGYLPTNNPSMPMPYPYWIHPLPTMMPL